MIVQINKETWTLQSKFAVKIQEIPANIIIKNKWPALRTVEDSHFQIIKTKKQTTKIKPTILNAKMKQGQNPELKSVVSGVGTVIVIIKE